MLFKSKEGARISKQDAGIQDISLDLAGAGFSQLAPYFFVLALWLSGEIS